MTQLYATGSAQPLTEGTITFLVTTPIEPSMSLFIQGFALGVATCILVLVVANFIGLIFEKKVIK